MDIVKTDVAIVGAGGGGLRAAIAIAEANPSLEIALISKVYPMRSHTVAAEGGAAITRIQDSAGEVVSVVNDISHSLSEQSLASNDIAQHVERIAQGAAANAGVAHETAAATVELHKLTHSLRESVSRFTV